MGLQPALQPPGMQDSAVHADNKKIVLTHTHYEVVCMYVSVESSRLGCKSGKYLFIVSEWYKLDNISLGNF